MRLSLSEQRLARLFDAIADSVEEMTDEEILAESREEGDPKVLAARVSDVIKQAIATVKGRGRGR